MQGNKKILVIAALLLLIAASYTTYAIYKTSVGVNANVTAAPWVVAFKNGQTTITDGMKVAFTADDCKDNTHVADGYIAPSYSCKKNITLDATGTKVDVKYSVTAGTPLDNGSTYPAAANDFSATITGGGEGTISYNGTQTVDVEVVLTWEGALADTDATNTADVGLQGHEITVPLTLVARQFVASES